MPTLVRKLSQIGNSKGLILPQTLLEMLDWGPDTEIELKISGNKLILHDFRLIGKSMHLDETLDQTGCFG